MGRSLTGPMDEELRKVCSTSGACGSVRTGVKDGPRTPRVAQLRGYMSSWLSQGTIIIILGSDCPRSATEVALSSSGFLLNLEITTGIGFWGGPPVR